VAPTIRNFIEGSTLRCIARRCGNNTGNGTVVKTSRCGRSGGQKEQIGPAAPPLAGIFRTYNLFEFKNPDERLDPNDYDKGMAIARLYKVIEHRKMLTLEEITMTFETKITGLDKDDIIKLKNEMN
jgi:hypothetical protein